MKESDSLIHSRVLDGGASGEFVHLPRQNAQWEWMRFLSAAQEIQQRHFVVVIETTYGHRVPAYQSWWDVPIAEISEVSRLRAARADYVEATTKQRIFCR